MGNRTTGDLRVADKVRHNECTFSRRTAPINLPSPVVCLRLYCQPKDRESVHSVWRFLLIFFCLLPPFKAAIDLVFKLGSFLSKISGLSLSESQRTLFASRFVPLPVLRITALFSCVKESPLCASQLMQLRGHPRFISDAYSHRPSRDELG